MYTTLPKPNRGEDSKYLGQAYSSMIQLCGEERRWDTASELYKVSTERAFEEFGYGAVFMRPAVIS
jgi:pentatricopeptide repeat protein